MAKKEKKSSPKVSPYSKGHWIAVIAILVVMVLLFVARVGQEECEAPDCPVCEECEECEECTTDCPECEPEIVEKEVAVVEYKYVCPDNKIVDSLEKCYEEEEPVEIPEPEPIDVEPITTNEEGTFITKVLVNPSCINRVPGGAISFDQITSANEVVFQVKDVLAGGDYVDMASFDNLKSANKEFVICDDCPHAVSFRLETGTVYLFRIKFDRTLHYDKIEYSNEHIIDARPGAKYLKIC